MSRTSNDEINNLTKQECEIWAKSIRRNEKMS